VAPAQGIRIAVVVWRDSTVVGTVLPVVVVGEEVSDGDDFRRGATFRGVDGVVSSLWQLPIFVVTIPSPATAPATAFGKRDAQSTLDPDGDHPPTLLENSP
jgi:hypothetical protein